MLFNITCRLIRAYLPFTVTVLIGPWLGRAMHCFFLSGANIVTANSPFNRALPTGNGFLPTGNATKNYFELVSNQ
jgi:hypothetical protein